MNQVLDYYKKLGYVFWDANHDGSTFINRTVVKNGVNISILIWSEKDGTELHLTCMDDDYILPSSFRKIVQNVVDFFK